MTERPALTGTLARIERVLADFYGFELKSQAAAHLVDRDQLRESLGDGVALLPEFAGRAGVYLVNDGGGGTGDLFIGIHLADDVQMTLAAEDPFAALSDRNLDAFCVAVEEVSHFHLILNRADREQGVSKLELEWQGEIDKLLVCASTLVEQAGDPHLVPLARKLFDTAVITAADEQLYWQATRYAARFWFAVARRGGIGQDVRELMRRSYDLPWAEKIAAIDDMGMRRAS